MPKAIIEFVTLLKGELRRKLENVFLSPYLALSLIASTLLLSCMGNVNERECMPADEPPSPCPTHDDGEGPSSPVLFVIEETPGYPSSVVRLCSCGNPSTECHSIPKRQGTVLFTGDKSLSLQTLEPPKREEKQIPRMDCHEYQDHAIDPVDVSREDSLPLSDSVIPTSFEFVVERSPMSSGESDVFHTPELSQLDIEGSQSSAEPSGSPPTLCSDTSILKELGTHSTVRPRTCSTHSDLDSKEFQADATDSDIFEYIPRGIDSDDPSSESRGHPPASIILLDQPNKIESGPKGPASAYRGIENTDPVTQKFEAKSEEIIPKLDALIYAPVLETAQSQVAIQKECHFVAEPIAPPKSSDEVHVASQDAKSVPDKVALLNLKLQSGFPSSGPEHTAERPNWALAPEDPPKPRTTLRRRGERGYGPRRGKQLNGDSSPESVPPKSSKTSHNGRRSKPSRPLIMQTSPAQKPMKVSSSGKQDLKEGPPVLETERRTLNTNTFYGPRSLMEPGPHRPPSPRLTQGSPTMDLKKRSRSSSVSINAFEISDTLSRRSPPWRRKSALVTIVESEPKMVNDEVRRVTLYQSFPPSETTKLKGVIMGGKIAPAIEATKDSGRIVAETVTSESNERSKREGPLQDYLHRFQPDPTLARGVRKVGRLSWPSSEEDHKTAQDREPLPWRSKANNQAFSRPYVPPIPSAPLPPPRPNQTAVIDVEVGNFDPSKETLCLGAQINPFHGEGLAQVNPPSKQLHIRPDPPDPTTLLGNDCIRPPFCSNIPIPTRTQIRSRSIQDGPTSQARVDAMGLPMSGLESPEKLSAPPGGLVLTHLPKLPRPGHIYRSASQPFIRQPDFQVGNSVPNPSADANQGFHGLQYYSLAGHQPTPAIILPMPNDASRPAAPPIPRSRPDYPFPDLAYVHNYQVNRACPQGPEMAHTGITQPPKTARLHRSTSLYGKGGEYYGLGLRQQMSGMPNPQLRSHNTNDPAVMLASRGFPNTPQRKGNAANLVTESPNSMH